MRKSFVFAGGLAVAGLVALGGPALTGSGLTNDAPASTFVGGTATASITGATLLGISYTFSDQTNTRLTDAELTFAGDAEGKLVTIQFSNGSNQTGTFSCELTHTSGGGFPPIRSTCSAITQFSVEQVAIDPTDVTITVSEPG